MQILFFGVYQIFHRILPSLESFLAAEYKTEYQLSTNPDPDIFPSSKTPKTESQDSLCTPVT